MSVFTIAENAAGLNELCAGARSLADRVEAILMADDESEAKAITAADKVWVIPAQPMIEDCVDTIAYLIEDQKPDVVLAASTVRMRLAMGRVAAKLGTSVIANAAEISADACTRTVYGGAGVAVVKPLVAPAIVTVGAGVLDPVEVILDPAVETVAFMEPALKIGLIEKVEKPKQAVDLTKAARVIGVGRGVKAEEDLQMVRELADAISGELGCTRPISEGEKWMPRESYIGVSGLVLKPDFYLALGISGQVQHTFGVANSKVFAVVNRDADAMIFDYADYGIVGDIYKVVPKLIEALK